MRIYLFSLSLIAGLVAMPSAQAEEPPGALSTLLRAAEQHAFTLYQGVRRTRGTKRYALRASFVLDTTDHVELHVLVSPFEDEQRTFEMWTGRVYDNAWVPRRTTLTDADELASARALWKQVEATPDVLSTALSALVRDKDNPNRPADLALTAEPRGQDGKTVVVAQARVDGALRSVTYDPATKAHVLAAPEADPKRVPPDVRTLPAFDVPLGRWFHADTPPTFAALRGHPVLVLVTSPG